MGGQGSVIRPASAERGCGATSSNGDAKLSKGDATSSDGDAMQSNRDGAHSNGDAKHSHGDATHSNGDSERGNQAQTLSQPTAAEGSSSTRWPPRPTPLTRHAKIEVPLICGAMYPCSNPDLVVAASDAGGIGIVQPLTLTYVHGLDFREALCQMRTRTDKPIGMNALIEKGSRRYHERMSEWVDIALEEGVRFFVTSLGKPRWVVDRVEPHGGVVYHDVTERKWALKGIESGVRGLIAVNRRAGGHAGPRGVEELFDEVGDLGVPVVCAGGVGSAAEFVRAIEIGYAGVQLGTRFIATRECDASDAYKQAILDAREEDIVLSERLTGVPVSVIGTPRVRRMGLKAGPLAKLLLRHRRTKHWMRLFYAVRSFRQLKQSLRREDRELWQAGKSAGAISSLESAGDIVRRYGEALGGGSGGEVDGAATIGNDPA